MGSGKSTALAYLRQFGAEVISADDVVHELYGHPEITNAVRERFGESVMSGEEVNRGAVARIVFADHGQLLWLESLLYPRVRERIAAWGQAAEATLPRPCMIVAEVPLLFESGMDKLFDFVVLITAPEDVRRERLSAKLTESEFAARLVAQMPEEEKLTRADFVFANTKSRRRLRDFLGQTVAQIIAGDAERTAPRGERKRAR